MHFPTLATQIHRKKLVQTLARFRFGSEIALRCRSLALTGLLGEALRAGFQVQVRAHCAAAAVQSKPRGVALRQVLGCQIPGSGGLVQKQIG